MENIVPRFNLNTYKKECEQATLDQDYVLTFRICQSLKNFPETQKYSGKTIAKLQSEPEIVQKFNQQSLKQEPNEKVKSELLSLLDSENQRVAYENCISELKVFPSSLFILQVAAQLAERIGHISKADIFYSKALKRDPLNVNLLRNYGLFLCTHSQPNEGRRHLYLCNQLEPKNDETIVLLANIENRLQNYSLEELHWQQIINKGSQELSHYGSYFNCLLEQGKVSSAKTLIGKMKLIFKEAWMIDVFQAYLQSWEGDYQTAIETLENIRVDQESKPVIHFELGNLHKKCGNNSAAQSHLEETLKIQPENALIKWNLAYIYLSEGNFKKGWEFYEARWQSKGWSSSYFHTHKPLWKGEENCKLLVWREQGIGDEIMFLSLLKYIPKNVSEIIIQCDKRLAGLIERAKIERVKILTKDLYGSDIDFDYHIPIGSLPLVIGFKPTSNAKKTTPYLIANKDLVAELNSSFRKDRNRRVGVSWKSSNSLFKDEKNIPLELLLKKISNEKITMINLQYGNIQKDLQKVDEQYLSNFMVFENINKFSDLESLAALIKCCDTIITSSNVTVHLASALGVPCHLILNKRHDWKWYSNTETSYWYPQCTLHKFETAKELRSILKHLGELIGQ